MYFGIKWTPLFISEFSCFGQSCLGQVMKYIAVSACVWKEVLALIFWIGFKCHSSLLSLVFLLVGCRARSVSLQKTIGPYDIYFMELHIKSPIHAMLSLQDTWIAMRKNSIYHSFITFFHCNRRYKHFLVSLLRYNGHNVRTSKNFLPWILYAIEKRAKVIRERVFVDRFLLQRAISTTREALDPFDVIIEMFSYTP